MIPFVVRWKPKSSGWWRSMGMESAYGANYLAREMRVQDCEVEILKRNAGGIYEAIHGDTAYDE